ncbi:MAG: Abi-alpha family protein [Thermodesulfobacteriota bacterium]
MSENKSNILNDLLKLGIKTKADALLVGGFLAKIFGTPLQEAAGIAHDHLRFVRWSRAVILLEKADQINADRGVTETRHVPPKLALPILENASLEEDEDIQKLWARLLANAMSPNFTEEIKSTYIDILKNLSASEVNFLGSLYVSVCPLAKKNITKLFYIPFKKEDLIKALNISEDQYLLTANTLMREQCIVPAQIRVGSIEGKPSTAYPSTDIILLSPLGYKLAEACIEDSETE